jgi:Ca2+-binding EF-hand superfamily protein
MMTELQTKKQTHYFNLVDIDNNGFIEKEDWEKIGENLAAMRNIEQGSETYKGIQAGLGTIWTNLQEHADVDSDGKVSLEEWLLFEDEKVINCDEEWYDSYVNNIVRGLFAVLDEDQNGVISQVEYINLMVSFHVSPSDARDAFQKLDSDGSGTIDEAELIQAVRDFRRSDKPETPGNWLFGPH